jgi:two-component sensor histidine kinase
MTQTFPFNSMRMDGSWLHVAELTHRISNEFATAIALTRVTAAQSANIETRTALSKVGDHLDALAGTYHALRAPATEQPVDLTAHLTRLCTAMSSVLQRTRGISLMLSIPEPVYVNSLVCWRAALILAELITNASRHAFGAGGGNIIVYATVESGRIICEVSDDGVNPGRVSAPGLGSLIVDALAAEFEGSIVRRRHANGTTIALSFPAGLTPGAGDFAVEFCSQAASASRI